MSNIIKISNENTLILIDEFGSGSDPEFGGVLAESFLDFFYKKKLFAIINTHYTNIKIRIESLNCATNAAMLFDKKTMTPTYKLAIGQPGSSFTFEMAKRNKIPKKIIQNAEKKLQKNQINLDKTLIKVQQKKCEIEKIQNFLKKEIIETKKK